MNFSSVQPFVLSPPLENTLGPLEYIRVDLYFSRNQGFGFPLFFFFLRQLRRSGACYQPVRSIGSSCDITKGCFQKLYVLKKKGIEESRLFCFL